MKLDDVDRTLSSIDESLKALAGGEREGSRYAGDGATAEVLDRLAAGGSYEVDRHSLRERQTKGGALPTEPQPRGLGASQKGVAFLRDVAAVARGDATAFGRLAKVWTEGVPGSGGFLVSPDCFRATSRRGAHRLRCATASRSSPSPPTRCG